MSPTISRQINCPECGAAQEATLLESVNVTVEPALKEKVFQGTVNAVPCLHCGREIRPVANLLYHDRNQNFMIWLRPDGARTGEEMSRRLVQLNMTEKILRIVHDEAALLEKIRIFDNKLDDAIIEFLKFRLWPDISRRRSASYTGREIRFAGFKWPLLSFDVHDGGGAKNFTFPYEEYVKCAPSVVPARSRITRGAWWVVDWDFLTASGLATEEAQPEKKAASFAFWAK